MTTPLTWRRHGLVVAALVGLLSPAALAVPASASATANEVVFAADDDNDGRYSVVLMDLGNRARTVVLPADGRIYDDPELSPNGARIAFSTDRGGSKAFDEGIAVVNRYGTGFQRLTEPTSSGAVHQSDVSPVWSPDGSRLLFTRITTDVTNPAATTRTLYTVAEDEPGTVVAVPDGAGGYTADYSPDGSKIVFAEVLGDADVGPLVVVNADGAGGRSPLGVNGLQPAWSPDGATIAYTTITSADPSGGRDVTQIGVVPATGGTGTVLAPTRPSSARTVAEYPAWTPDSTSLLYDLYTHGSRPYSAGDLWAVDRAGVRAGRVTATSGDEAQPQAHGPAPVPVVAGTASTYTPVTPQRILDTRAAPDNVGAPVSRIGPGKSIDLAVRGVTTSLGPVPADATAVVLNLTATEVTASTDVRVYPSGALVPGVSNVNVGAGQTIANLVTVAIGSNGSVTLRNRAGLLHLIADIAGYYRPGSLGSGFAPVEPGRILDTRSPAVGAPVGKVGPGGVLDLTVTGDLQTADGRTSRVPADAVAVVLNVTATGATEGTDIRVYGTPVDSAVPRVSNVNIGAGQTIPNLVTVGVGEGGKVRLRNRAGAVNLIADLAGYYAASAGGRFVPVVPLRFLDTRAGVGGTPIPVTEQAYVDLGIGGTRGIPAGASAAVLNLTVTGVSSSTDVRAYPTGLATVPTVSNVNAGPGSTRANLAVVRLGDAGRIRVRNNRGQAHVIADLAGYMIG